MVTQRAYCGLEVLAKVWHGLEALAGKGVPLRLAKISSPQHTLLYYYFNSTTGLN
jgi:hypothetical protein